MSVYDLLRPLLFQFDAESIHRAVMGVANTTLRGPVRAMLRPYFTVDDARLRTRSEPMSRRADSSIEACPCERGREVLRESGLRITPQRAAILELFTRRDGHWTPQRIVTALENCQPSLSQATVYNTLETFEQIGLLTRFTTPDGETVFDRNVSDHQHAVCTCCGSIFDLQVPDDALLAVFRQSDAALEFEVSGASMWLRGVCRSCRG